MMKAQRVLVCFGVFAVYAGIFWEMLISCCILLSLSVSLHVFVSPSFFSFHPSIPSAHTSIWLQPPSQSTWLGYEKGNRQTTKCNYRIDSSIAEDASPARVERACGRKVWEFEDGRHKSFSEQTKNSNFLDKWSLRLFFLNVWCICVEHPSNKHNNFKPH